MNKNKQTHHKRAHSRRWYLQNSDWIISHEIEDNVAELLDETNEDDKKGKTTKLLKPCSENFGIIIFFFVNS